MTDKLQLKVRDHSLLFQRHLTGKTLLSGTFQPFLREKRSIVGIPVFASLGWSSVLTGAESRLKGPKSRRSFLANTEFPGPERTQPPTPMWLLCVFHRSDRVTTNCSPRKTKPLYSINAKFVKIRKTKERQCFLASQTRLMTAIKSKGIIVFPPPITKSFPEISLSGYKKHL